MVLDENLVLQYILEPQNKHLKDYRSEHSKLDSYFNGGDIASQIQKITNFENKGQETLRKKIARSPKDVIHKLLKQFNKSFSATGGSELLDIKPDNRKNEFSELISELPEGISLKKWMQDYWLEAYITDPNGLIVIEAETGNNPKSYPTYKSINVIHDYTTTWQSINYLILKHGKYQVNKKEVQVYRVIDDEKDALYYVSEDEKSLKEFETDTESHKLIHQKGFVPAIVISDILDKKTKGRKSFISKIDELLDEYVRENSVLSIFKFLHAYPKYWQYASTCTTCKGVGTVKDTSTSQQKTCTSCNGKKLNLTLDVSDGIMLPLPKANQPVLAPNIAGFTAPPIDAWEKMEQTLDKLEKKMEFAMLGTYSDAEKSNTATGRFIDSQPIVSELHKFSTSEETIKEKIADYMAKWMYGNDYGKISIKNGKRFVAEHPDVIFEKYTKAKEKHAPVSTLDYLYKQYLLSEYQNDTMMYEQKLKEFCVEPLVHFTVQELDSLKTDMSLQVQEKIYYSEWILQDINWSKPLENLKTEFETFINAKNLNNASTTEG